MSIDTGFLDLIMINYHALDCTKKNVRKEAFDGPREGRRRYLVHTDLVRSSEMLRLI
ncbi:hypothetical protein CLV32_1326 [Pedobacter duraquae]|uniref:Uncharacterized protein n=1 Tax=Pedobacter duraquae TaxID=425511 RepID=A0A4R6IK03_9SPHI|nr:hypothetical protein CLV32_1326 [Pedobacter duraquae]